jgi:hypothetical protein
MKDNKAQGEKMMSDAQKMMMDGENMMKMQ